MPPDPTRKPIIVVIGMHRSGTSLCANVLHSLGIDMASEANPSPENQRGHWERPRLNDLNEMVFALFNRRWNDYAHVLSLPADWWQERQVLAVQADIVAWLRPRLDGQKPFGFKDPRTARLLPMWTNVFTDLNLKPIYVFCLRDPAQVARSISARDRIAREQSEYRWLIYNAAAIAGIGHAPICIVPYEDWFAQPAATVQRLARFVGSPQREDGPHMAALAADLVDRSLRHDDGEPQTVAGQFSRRLHRAVLDCVPAQKFSETLLTLCDSVADFERLVQPMLISSEVLRASVADQNRVIEDLNTLIGRLRRENQAMRENSAGPQLTTLLP